MKMISSDSIHDLLTDDDREQAAQIQAGRIAAITWLKLARKPSGQVADRLRCEFSEPVVQEVLRSLQEDGTLNDAALASRLVRQRQGRRAESRAALAMRLRNLGLAGDAIEAALPDRSADLASARELVGSRFSRQSDDFRKAGRFLASRGFSREVIVQVLHECFSDFDSREAGQS